jgi:hypothetical protein
MEYTVIIEDHPERRKYFLQSYYGEQEIRIGSTLACELIALWGAKEVHRKPASESGRVE